MTDKSRLVLLLGAWPRATLARHAHGDEPDAGPRIEPGLQRVKRPVVRGAGKPGESEQELAALVEHALLTNYSIAGATQPREHGP